MNKKINLLLLLMLTSIVLTARNIIVRNTEIAPTRSSLFPYQQSFFTSPLSLVSDVTTAGDHVPNPYAAETIKQDFKSAETGDTYTVAVKKPNGFDSSKTYQVIYAPDGSLKLGNYIIGTDKDWAATLPKQTVVITVAHQNGHVMQRQRDFIPSDAGGYSDKEFGQAKKFYQFLKKELLPWALKKVPHQSKKVFIGHSFSGLFCLYLTLQNDKLFDKHYAISPSVWANHEEIMKIEKNYAETHKKLAATVTIFAGSLEVLNKVLSSATRFYEKVRERKYEGCKIRFETINWANHYSIIKPAVDKIMKELGG
jgi:uncharacterized protein